MAIVARDIFANHKCLARAVGNGGYFDRPQPRVAKENASATSTAMTIAEAWCHRVGLIERSAGIPRQVISEEWLFPQPSVAKHAGVARSCHSKAGPLEVVDVKVFHRFVGRTLQHW